MKVSTFISVVALLVAPYGYAQQIRQPEWTVSAPNGSILTIDSAGNTYVAGEAPVGFFDIQTAKYDSNGNQVWSATFDGGSVDQPTAIAVDSIGNTIMAGISGSPSCVRSCIVVIKYDSSGNQLWSRLFNFGPGSTPNIATDLAVDSLDNIYVTGAGSTPGAIDMITLKYDSNGNLQWVRSIDNGGVDAGTALALAPGDEILVTGRTRTATAADFVTIKYDSAGNTLWQASYDGIGRDDAATDIDIDGFGNTYVTGTSEGPTSGFDIATIKYDSVGTELWAARHDGGPDSAPALTVDAAGNAYVAGRSGIADGFLTLKYDSTGALQWANREDFGSPERANSVALDSAGDIYVSGRGFFFLQNSSQKVGGRVFKYNSAGQKVWEDHLHTTSFGGGGLHDVVVDGALNVYLSQHFGPSSILKYNQVPDIDSDGDSVSDPYEIKYATDPADADSYPVFVEFNFFEKSSVFIFNPGPGRPAEVSKKKKAPSGVTRINFFDQDNSPVSVRTLGGFDLDSDLGRQPDRIFVIIPKTATMTEVSVVVERDTIIGKKLKTSSASASFDFIDTVRYPERIVTEISFGVSVQVFP